MRMYMWILAVLLLAAPAHAEPGWVPRAADAAELGSSYERHEAICRRGEHAVCAAPARSFLTLRWYHANSLWRVVFDLMTRGSPGPCHCTRKYKPGSVELHCTCTWRT